MKTPLYNTAHPLAESGKPIFIPFGEWDYDGTCRQRLDRAHGERIANELNARVVRGEPGIPVYAGNPDVPQLAARYPDKGALGWVVRAELVNESPDGRAVPGLALTVEWDRDPGRGFRWFSPYWIANEREGNCHIVAEIASIGLVNNPNIPEFRLANESQGGEQTKGKAFAMPQHLIELARRYDERVRLANEANFDESKHPRAADGKFSSGGGGGGAAGGRTATAQREFDDALKALQDGQRRGWSKEENDKASKRYLLAERKLKEAKELDRRDKVLARPGAPKQPSTIRESDFRTQPEFVRARPREALIKELAAIYADKRAGRL